MNSRRVGLLIVVLLGLVSSVPAAEARRYTFIGDTANYRFSCGECAGPPYELRARVGGTFDVELDSRSGVGTLLSLNAKLTNFEGNFGIGLYANDWQPIDRPPQNFLGDANFYDLYRPPVTGSLSPAQFRPLGPGTLTAEHTARYSGVPILQIPNPIRTWMLEGVGFEAAPEGSWLLSFDLASLNIYLEGKEALFSYTLPFIDAVPSIAAARAVLVPEPCTLALAWMALALPWRVLRLQKDRF